MKDDIIKLSPAIVWKNFYKLTQIPRPSKKEGQVIKFMEQFGQNLGLETIKDEVGNILIRKPATHGMEKRKGMILQAHLDMVPQKNSDKVHDFEKDPIETLVDGEWVRANKTTLGADNGIGAASIMSVLESKDIVHGPLEALFTIDEETGMTGAFALKPGMLKGDILLNTDSEDEGELYIGCAGGVDANIRFKYSSVPVKGDYIAYKLIVKGLKGGHSGLDINLERANSNLVLTRILWRATFKFKTRLAALNGGDLRNAIPREAMAVILVPSEKEQEFKDFVDGHVTILKAEYQTTEPDMNVFLEKVALPETLIDEETQNKLISAIYTCPNGVIRMSADIEGLVETSTNLAIVKTEKDIFSVQCLLRSSVDSAKEDLSSRIRALFELAGAEVNFTGSYPGWKPNPGSAILNTMKEVYHKKFGKVPEVKAIHAGLECGIIGGIYPNLDMISFGPTIRSPHSPDERVKIDTVQKFWDFLVETLKNVPGKEK
ncbi:MAG: aminoacyl-histidine dipeptidase [Bacteroidales bacterium]|nr:aminoacyl-histidine dipeptidase [Bacteroidales bacterium]